MGTFGSNLRIPTELEYYSQYGGPGQGATIGHEFLQANLGPDTINSTITSHSSDIVNDPQWTDLISLTGKYELFPQVYMDSAGLYLRINSDATPSNLLRIQVLIDDIVVLDLACQGDGANNSYIYMHDLAYLDISSKGVFPLYCNNSFKIRGARHGTQDGSSYMHTGNWGYRKLA